jgi:hypothetical protein
MDFEKHKAYLELLAEADNMVGAFIDIADDSAYHYAKKVKYAFVSNQMETVLGNSFENLCPNCVSAIEMTEEG